MTSDFRLRVRTQTTPGSRSYDDFAASDRKNRRKSVPALLRIHRNLFFYHGFGDAPLARTSHAVPLGAREHGFGRGEMPKATRAIFPDFH